MSSSLNSWFAAEEKVDASPAEEEMEMDRWVTPRRHKTSLLVILLIFGGLLSIISIAKLRISLLGDFSMKENEYLGEKTSYIPRGPTHGDQYLLGVGKADITGFVRHC